MTLQLELTTIRRQWIDEAIPVVLDYGRTVPEFGSDDLHNILPVPQHPNYFGVLFSQLKARNLITEAGFRMSKNRAANGRKLQTWRLI